MRNIKLTLQYLGTHYCGWQIQPNGPTIQELLQKVLEKTLQEKIIIIGAGRTDAGVHALGQVAHFKTQHAMDIGTLWRALNAQLPEDIAVLAVEEAPEKFHAQKDALSKTYCYCLLNTEQKIPFLYPYTWRIFGDLDLDEMNQSAAMLPGQHDFRSFCAADSTAKTFIRRILEVNLRQIPLADLGNSLLDLFGLAGMISVLGAQKSFHPEKPDGAIVVFSVKGEGFLKHMVRNIVGTLVEVGRGKINAEDFRRVFLSRDRTQAGITAPAKGLFLIKTDYPPLLG